MSIERANAPVVDTVKDRSTMAIEGVVITRQLEAPVDLTVVVALDREVVVTREIVMIGIHDHGLCRKMLKYEIYEA